MLLHVEQNNDRTTSSNHRVIWCPYIPEEENSDVTYDDVAKLLVLTHGAKVNSCFYSHVKGRSQIAGDLEHSTWRGGG